MPQRRGDDRRPTLEVRDDGTWVRAPLDDAWDVEGRLISQSGTLVIAELRVLPAHDVPAGGLTIRKVRSVTLSRLRELALAATRPHAGRHRWTALGRSLEAAGLADAGERKRPGRRGHDDLFYATVAAAYVDAHKRGDRDPIPAAARDLNERFGDGAYTPAYVRELLRTARKRGLLTPPPTPRRPGGELTERTLRVLRGNDTSEEE